MSGETWLVLGASSAIAKAFARAAAARGDAVLLAGRDQEDMATTACDLEVRSGVETHVLLFDATATATHDAFLDRVAERRRGPLNVFLAVAAMTEQSALAGEPEAELAIAEATYLGPVSILARLAAMLEAEGAGRIVALGSVAGDRGRPKNYAYGAAKAGLHAYLQGLRSRLWKSGVTVTTIKPGFVDTAMTWGLDGLFLVATPKDMAEACLRHALAGAEVRYVPAFWWAIMTIIRLIPERIFKRLNF